MEQFNERKKATSKACQVELLVDSKHREYNVSSVACQVDMPPSCHDMHNPATLPVTNSEPLQTEVNSFSESNSVDSSVSSEQGDIITIVTADQVTASVLHADIDTSSISVDQEQHIVTPLCSPSRKNNNSRQTANKNIVTVEEIVGVDSAGTPLAKTDGSNRKSVRFQDSSQDHDIKPLQSTSISVALDKVFIHMYIMHIHIYKV